MPNPLADSFAAACLVRPEIGRDIERDYLNRGWQSRHIHCSCGHDNEAQWVSDDLAEMILEAACWRVLPGYSWDRTDEKGVVLYWITNKRDQTVAGPCDTLAVALLSAVAGLGADTKGQVW